MINFCIHNRAVIIPVLDPNPDSELRRFLTFFNSNSNSESGCYIVLDPNPDSDPDSAWGVFWHSIVPIPIPNPAKNGIITALIISLLTTFTILIQDTQRNIETKRQPDCPNMTLLSSNTTASDDSSWLPERVKEPPIRPRSTGSAGDASEAKHLRPSLAPAHLGTDHRDYNLATLTVLVRDGEVTFEKEFSSSSSYFQMRNFRTLVTSVTVTTIKIWPKK